MQYGAACISTPRWQQRKLQHSTLIHLHAGLCPHPELEDPPSPVISPPPIELPLPFPAKPSAPPCLLVQSCHVWATLVQQAHAPIFRLHASRRCTLGPKRGGLQGYDVRNAADYVQAQSRPENRAERSASTGESQADSHVSRLTVQGALV